MARKTPPTALTAFQRDFFTSLMDDLALPRAVASDFPPGVVATARTDGETTYVFLQNYSAQQQQVTLPQGYQDSLTGVAVNAPLSLKAWDCRILSRRA